MKPYNIKILLLSLMIISVWIRADPDDDLASSSTPIQLTQEISTLSPASFNSLAATPSTPSSESHSTGSASPAREEASSCRRITLRPIVKKIDVAKALKTIRQYTEKIARITFYTGHLAEFIFWMSETNAFLDEYKLTEAFKGICRLKFKLKHAVKIKNAFSLLIESRKELIGEKGYFEAQQIIQGLTYTHSESATVWVEHEKYKAQIIKNYHAKIAELNLLLFPPPKKRFVPATLPRVSS
jgi:hypothetical protein